MRRLGADRGDFVLNDFDNSLHLLLAHIATEGILYPIQPETEIIIFCHRPNLLYSWSLFLPLAELIIMPISQGLDDRCKSSVNLFIGQGTVIITEIQSIG